VPAPRTSYDVRRQGAWGISPYDATRPRRPATRAARPASV